MNKVLSAFLTAGFVTMILVGAIVAFFVATRLQAEVMLAGRVMLLAIAGGTLIAVAVGLLWLWGWLTTGNQARAARVEQERAAARRAHAEAARIERDSVVWTEAHPAGQQVYRHELRPGTHSTPLHLAPGRVNGEPSEQVTIEQLNNWRLNQLAHSTARQTGDVGAVPLIEGPPPVWPDRINLLDLLQGNQGNLESILLGVTIEGGQLRQVTAALEKMVHIAVGGASGWGKSEFLRALAFQIATAPQLAELALIDIEAATFSTFATSPKLRYPVADNERDILAVFADLQAEIEHRKALFNRFPTVDKLSSYNTLANEPLSIIAVLIDEGTVLLSDNPDVERLLKSTILRARKYGVFATIGGQSWKATDFDTAIRGQFSTTVHFQARDKASSRVLLGDPAAADLDRPGRAYAIIPGQKMIELQAPALSLMATQRAIPAGSAPPPMPAAPEPEPDPLEAEILALASQGESLSAIARAKLGGDGGNQINRVRAVLAKFQGTVAP